jgi:hypothetical protein
LIAVSLVWMFFFTEMGIGCKLCALVLMAIGAGFILTRRSKPAAETQRAATLRLFNLAKKLIVCNRCPAARVTASITTLVVPWFAGDLGFQDGSGRSFSCCKQSSMSPIL